jgi:hypothetical protein
MITIKQRDEILNEMFPHAGEGMLDGAAIASIVGVAPKEVMKVIDYLIRRGYIEFVGMAQFNFYFDTTLNGDDFYRRGGFEYEDTIAQMELNKLIFELQSLEELIPNEKYNRLMQGLGVIMSALALTKS